MDQGGDDAMRISSIRPPAHRRDVIAELAASRPGNLEPPSPGSARARAAAIIAEHPIAHHLPDRLPAGRPVIRRTMLAAVAAITAAGAAVALVLAGVVAVPVHRATSESAPEHHHSRARPARNLTARAVLLAAAAHVANVPVTGKYWRVTMIGGLTVPAGTTANPYDISIRAYADQWNPSSAGQREWQITQQLGARPDTPADAAAWRAAGSPARWHSGLKPHSYPGGYPVQWNNPLAVTTAASARSATWQVSDGTVGFVEGDLAGLDAAQFRKVSARPQRVEALLRHYALRARCRYSRCSSVNQLMWAEAVMLLQDPVSAPVRAATFKVMAALPGVRLIGPMTDPLGRPGYAIAGGSQDPNADPRNFNPTRVVLIDPRSGSLLATAELGPMPRSLHCLSFGPKNNCTGSTYKGRSYQRQVDDYVAVVREGWTNASPQLPPPDTWSGNGCCAGLPPLP
jgi:hypothetical protein